MFNLIPAKLPEKYESTICCDVCVDAANKSFQLFKPVSVDVLNIEFACQFGFANLLNFLCVIIDCMLTVSIYVGFCSSTIQHLKLISYCAGNGSYNFI